MTGPVEHCALQRAAPGTRGWKNGRERYNQRAEASHLQVPWPRFIFFVLIVAAGCLAQTPSGSLQAPAPAPPSPSEKWNLFETETLAPITLAAGVFDAGISQASNGVPNYGRGFSPGFVERFGAGFGDIASQNFFGDFVMASVLHEDTRYVRRGPAVKFWSRMGYAISRSVVTHTDGGRATFNWSNVLGTGMSAGLSNAYYPPQNRKTGVTLADWATEVAGSGFANLFPEFWPDFRGWVRRRLHPGR